MNRRYSVLPFLMLSMLFYVPSLMAKEYTQAQIAKFNQVKKLSKVYPKCPSCRPQAKKYNELLNDIKAKANQIEYEYNRLQNSPELDRGLYKSYMMQDIKKFNQLNTVKKSKKGF